MSVWYPATVLEVVRETDSARTIVLSVPKWPGHLAGQHVDVRLTADDGYTAVRSYSIASAPATGRIDVTVERVDDGEVSPYLVDVAVAGVRLEVRGPIGGWFVWRPEQVAPMQLVAGGSGIVPLMAMVRTRDQSASEVPISLLYSVRTPDMVIYRSELAKLVDAGRLSATYAYTRQTPAGSSARPGRIDGALVAAATWPPAQNPDIYVCGPTGFVEAANTLLAAVGHDPTRIKAERFGPT